METEKNYEDDLKKIRSMPINMAQKRLLKSKLDNLPKKKLEGTERLSWNLKRICEWFYRKWKRFRSRGLWHKSLQDIEIRGGTSIVNVFLFIKYTVYFNAFLFLVIVCFIILPYTVSVRLSVPDDETCPPEYVPDRDLEFMNESWSWNSDEKKKLVQMSECCVENVYRTKNKFSRNESVWVSFSHLFDLSQDSFFYTPLAYGYYSHYNLAVNKRGLYFDFQKNYVLVPVVTFIISLMFIVWQIGVGIKEMVMAKGGEFYNFSNLIFCGWDHFAKETHTANFRRKILINEMKLSLRNKRLRIIQLSNQQQYQLFIKRILANVLVFICFLIIMTIVISAADFALRKKAKNVAEQFALRLLPSIVIGVCNLIFPIILREIKKLELYSNEVQTILILIRAFLVRILGIGVVAFKYYQGEYCQKADYSCDICKHDPNDDEAKLKDKHPCWESVFAFQIYTILVIDLVLKAVTLFILQCGRLLLGKVCKHEFFEFNKQKFNIIRHSLDIIYIQSLGWFFYFAPFLPFFVTIYCIITKYMKKFTLIFLCQNIPDTFRSTRTTTLYVAVKLLALVLAAFAVGYVLTSLEPSRSCGPFRGLTFPSDAVPLEKWRYYDIILSPAFIIPLLLIMILLSIYYYTSAKAHSKMVDTLRHILILEGHDKQYLFGKLKTMREEARLNTINQQSKENKSSIAPLESSFRKSREITPSIFAKVDKKSATLDFTKNTKN